MFDLTIFDRSLKKVKLKRKISIQMQQGKIDHKKDGITTLKYELVGEEILTPWAKMINIKL